MPEWSEEAVIVRGPFTARHILGLSGLVGRLQINVCSEILQVANAALVKEEAPHKVGDEHIMTRKNITHRFITKTIHVTAFAGELSVC